MITRALLSVSDKTGLLDFARFLEGRSVEILSTGGTAKFLREGGIAVRDVSAFTEFPEIFDGRVKTLHPRIHGGLLFRREKSEHVETARKEGIAPIDLIVVNLYPFAETVQKEQSSEEEVIENIDIGGPGMLRSAAKNFTSVTVIADPADYRMVQAEIEEKGDTMPETRRRLAAKVFVLTARYDTAIAAYFDPDFFALTGEKIQNLRYGENPHQKAAFYRLSDPVFPSIATARQLQGKELSFNNILDADAALRVVSEFSDMPAATVIKHLNPCGTAGGETVEKAFEKAYGADSLSAFGGIVAVNRPVGPLLAEKLSEVFLEIVVAPEFTPQAETILTARKNLRLLAVGPLQEPPAAQDIKSVSGGFLVQDTDVHRLTPSEFREMTTQKPTPSQMENLLFAWRVSRHVKSNAIVLAKDLQTVGVGAGQMSRVDSVEIALRKAGEKSRGAVCASDAFFPFPDSIFLLAEAGITAIIQPGGSQKDDEVIAAAEKAGIAMVFTGKRAFRH